MKIGIVLAAAALLAGCNYKGQSQADIANDLENNPKIVVHYVYDARTDLCFVAATSIEIKGHSHAYLEVGSLAPVTCTPKVKAIAKPSA